MSEIVGLESLNRKLAAMQTYVLGNLGVPIHAGLLVISNQAKENIDDSGTHPQITGNYARSIHNEIKVSGQTATGRTGTNVEYARRHEFLPGHAVLRPAFDQKKDEAKQEVLDALQALVAAAIR